MLGGQGHVQCKVASFHKALVKIISVPDLQKVKKKLLYPANCIILLLVCIYKTYDQKIQINSNPSISAENIQILLPSSGLFMRKS